MRNKLLKIGLIAGLVYLAISPYRFWFFALMALFAAYTLYRYILFRAEQEAGK